MARRKRVVTEPLEDPPAKRRKAAKRRTEEKEEREADDETERDDSAESENSDSEEVAKTGQWRKGRAKNTKLDSTTQQRTAAERGLRSHNHTLQTNLATKRAEDEARLKAKAEEQAAWSSRRSRRRAETIAAKSPALISKSKTIVKRVAHKSKIIVVDSDEEDFDEQPGPSAGRSGQDIDEQDLRNQSWDLPEFGDSADEDQSDDGSEYFANDEFNESWQEEIFKDIGSMSDSIRRVWTTAKVLYNQDAHRIIWSTGKCDIQYRRDPLGDQKTDSFLTSLEFLMRLPPFQPLDLTNERQQRTALLYLYWALWKMVWLRQQLLLDHGREVKWPIHEPQLNALASEVIVPWRRHEIGKRIDRYGSRDLDECDLDYGPWVDFLRDGLHFKGSRHGPSKEILCWIDIKSIIMSYHEWSRRDQAGNPRTIMAQIEAKDDECLKHMRIDAIKRDWAESMCGRFHDPQLDHIRRISEESRSEKKAGYDTPSNRGNSPLYSSPDGSNQRRPSRSISRSASPLQRNMVPDDFRRSVERDMSLEVPDSEDNRRRLANQSPTLGSLGATVEDKWEGVVLKDNWENAPEYMKNVQDIQRYQYIGNFGKITDDGEFYFGCMAMRGEAPSLNKRLHPARPLGKEHARPTFVQETMRTEGKFNEWVKSANGKQPWLGHWE